MSRDIPGYFDEKLIAEQHGFQMGQMQGYEDGRRAGYNAGYTAGYEAGHSNGHDEGYASGWDAGIARGNEEILKQMEFTRQHSADKEVLARQLQDRFGLIDSLTARVAQLERENTTLQQSNENLRAEAAQLSDKYKARSKEFSDHVWQYNRTVVILNAARATLEALTSIGAEQAKQVRALFTQKYDESVSNGLTKGAIKIAPEKDECFVTAMPKTQKFILDMQAKGGGNKTTA